MSSTTAATLSSAPATTATTTSATTRTSDCRKFSPNIFNKSKCSHCFRQREEHSAAALECNRVSETFFLVFWFFCVACFVWSFFFLVIFVGIWIYVKYFKVFFFWVLFFWGHCHTLLKV